MQWKKLFYIFYTTEREENFSWCKNCRVCVIFSMNFMFYVCGGGAVEFAQLVVHIQHNIEHISYINSMEA